MAATLSPPNGSQAFREFRCGCGQRALLVKLRDGMAVVEAEPIVPRHRCPQCEQLRRQRKNWVTNCLRCMGTGWIGEEVPTRTVAISPEGTVRWRRNERCVAGRERRIREGESLHAVHTCPALLGMVRASRSEAWHGFYWSALLAA